MKYFTISVLLVVCYAVASAQTFSCGQEWQDHFVDQCPRSIDPAWYYMNCCSQDSEIIPSTGIRVKTYGCCAGLPQWMYIALAVAAVVIIASITACCCCCGCCKRQQRGFVVFQNPPMTPAVEQRPI